MFKLNQPSTPIGEKMNKQEKMARGARKVVKTCAQVKSGEIVIILTEPSMDSIAKVVATEVEEVNAEPIVITMLPRKTNGEEPPKAAAEAMKYSDVFISAVNTSITHTEAVKNAISKGSRGILMTQFTEKLLMGGGIQANFPKIAPTCK